MFVYVYIMTNSSSIYLSMYPSIHRPIDRSIYRSTYRSIDLDAKCWQRQQVCPFVKKPKPENPKRQTYIATFLLLSHVTNVLALSRMKRNNSIICYTRIFVLSYYCGNLGTVEGPCEPVVLANMGEGEETFSCKRAGLRPLVSAA